MLIRSGSGSATRRSRLSDFENLCCFGAHKQPEFSPSGSGKSRTRRIEVVLHIDENGVCQDLRDYFEFPTNMRVRGWRETLLQERCIVVLKQALAVYIGKRPGLASED
jgi:hypothetical protein